MLFLDVPNLALNSFALGLENTGLQTRVIGISWISFSFEFLFLTDSKNNPRSMTNSKGKKRQVNGKELSAALKTNDALFVDFINKCLE